VLGRWRAKKPLDSLCYFPTPSYCLIVTCFRPSKRPRTL